VRLEGERIYGFLAGWIISLLSQSSCTFSPCEPAVQWSRLCRGNTCVDFAYALCSKMSRNPHTSYPRELNKDISVSGRSIAQTVSGRLPTAAARVRAQIKSCEICGGQSGTGAGFLRVLRFPLPILIPPTALIIYHPGLVQ
jgi:hypothetical protein